MAESTALVTVASGSYLGFADRLMESAREHFHPTDLVDYVILEGIEGWPVGTMCRHRVLLDHLPRANYVYLVDADCLFEQEVGPEILPPYLGITAVQHPGFVHQSRVNFSYETRAQSAAWIGPHEGTTYYAGGFVGGERLAMKILSVQIDDILEADAKRGIVPVYHDESALNRVLVDSPPQVTLSPAYLHPDRDEWYRSVWPEDYERKLVCLDKTAAERALTGR